MLFLGWIVLAGVVAIIADSKGRTVWKWFVYGFFLWPIALVHVIVSPANRANVEAAAVERGDLRKCPFCAEIVKVEALVCRFCQRELPPVPLRPTTVAPHTEYYVPTPMPVNAARLRLSIVAAAVVVVAALVASRVAMDRASAQTASQSSDAATDSVGLLGACADRGIRHFESTGELPRLRDGRDARSVALARCDSSLTAY